MSAQATTEEPTVSSPAPAGRPDLEQELAKLKAATEATGASAAAWVALGNCQMQKARNTLVHDFSPAKKSFKKALALDTGSAEAMVGMAWVKNSEHQFEEGKKWAEKAIAIDPRAHDAHALIGDYAVELGEYDEAYDHYQTALDLRADLSSYGRAGHLLWLVGDSAQAQLLMEKAIAAGGPYPENTAWCRAELALMQFHSGAFLAAELQAGKAMQAAPDNPRVLSIMARIKAAKGDLDSAIELYRKSASITPSHEALAALVDLYQVKGESKLAKDYVAKVLAYHSPSHGHHHHHGESHNHGHDHGAGAGSAERALFLAEQNKQLKEAVAEAEKVYQTYRNVRVEETLAWCYYQAGDYQKARRMIERAMRWNTSESILMFRAGMIYLKGGDPKKSFAMLNKCVSLNPNFHPIHSKTATDALRDLSLAHAERKE